MSALALAPVQIERAETRTRTRWSMVTSAVLHALLFAWILLLPHRQDTGPAVTEISFLEGGEPSAAAPAAPATAPRLSPGAVLTRTVSQAFRRVMARGDVEPDPQDGNPEDQIQARLAALQNAATRPSAGTVTGAPSSMASGAPAVPGGTGMGGSPIALARGGGLGGTSPLPMVRGAGTGGSMAPALAPTPAVERSEASQPAREGESTARRTLAGATLMGPIADREVLVHVTPDYPDWAKREGVEGSVTLYFVVRADGTIKENILVQKTAGFSDFDDNARTALRQWRFEPLRDGRTGEQWGTITFRFRIRG